MKKFTFSDLNRASGEILETALMEPVALTRRGKEKVIMLSVDTYKQLVGASHAEAYTLEAAPQHVHDELMAGLDNILAGDDNA